MSLSSAAVALATERLGTLIERRVLVLGAGEMGEGMARSLAGSGVAEVVVAGRGTERASDLAPRVGGRAIPIDGSRRRLVAADLVLTSTGATDIVIDPRRRRGGHGAPLRAAAAHRRHRRPPGRRPRRGRIPGVTLLDMDDLKAFAESSMDRRRREVARVRRDHLRRARTAPHRADGPGGGPLVVALRPRGEDVRLAELDRFRSKLEGVDARTAEAIEALTRGIVAKLLHEPTVRVKEAAGSGRGELYADALSALFDLDAD